MTSQIFPSYLQVPPDQLGRGTGIRIRVRSDLADLYHDFAWSIFEVIEYGRQRKKPATLIIPVGPVDQFPILAELINRRRLDCRDVVMINMDEFLDERDRPIPLDHPLSFHSFINRKFFDLLDPALAPRPENRVFPEPDDLDAVQRLIDARGGVDVCFGGMGINGHVAFNEPPEPPESADTFDDDAYATRSCHVLTPTRETCTIYASLVGGDITAIPPRAVTVGMKQVLESKAVHLYCGRPFQGAIVRRALHGPVTAACPASFLQRHPNATITVSHEVAQTPQMCPR